MNKRVKLILVGGGGHCASTIDVIERTGGFSIIGILDHPEKMGNRVLGYEVIGTDNDIERFAASDVCFLITVGQIKNSLARKSLHERVLLAGGNIATVISPLAYVSPHATIGQGTVVMHFAFVNAGAQVGSGCILNTKSLIEHDSYIGDFTHISTGAIVNGDCIIGGQTFIGSNATVANGNQVGSGCIIGAGAVVINFIEDNTIAAGVPATIRHVQN